MREPWPTDHPDYPRRLLQRADWQLLDGEWSLHLDDGRAERPEHVPGWEHVILVPFAPESEASGIGDTGFHADVWYQREVELPATRDRTILHFGAVDYRARVWVDGEFVGEHEGGHVPFGFDITSALGAGDRHVITVWAHDDPAALDQPRGKQDWELEAHGIWYPRTSGIWQSVWVERVPERRIDRVTLSPELATSTLGIGVAIAGAGDAELAVRVRCAWGDASAGELVIPVRDGRAEATLQVAAPTEHPIAWGPANPALLDVDLELVEGDAVTDEVRSYTAFRTVGLEGDRFLLNGEPLILRLVLDQGYWPHTLMTPPSEAAIIADIRLAIDAGFTGVRKHQKIEDPRYLYWADRLGLLVWEEQPSAYVFTAESVERITREWMAAIARDSGHPCIVAWVPLNESWGVPDLHGVPAQREFVNGLYHLTRALDPTRPVIGNDGWEACNTDIVGIHDYEGDPEVLRSRYHEPASIIGTGRPAGRAITLDGHDYAGQPVMLSEFGGIAFGGEPGSWGYTRSDDRDDFAERYRAMLQAVHSMQGIAGFCYTQFTDVFQEVNGLFTAGREPKFDLESMRAATRGAATARGESSA